MIGRRYLDMARDAARLAGAPDVDTATDRAVLRWARAAGFGVARWRRPGQWSDRAREKRRGRKGRAVRRRARSLWRTLPPMNRAARRNLRTFLKPGRPAPT